MNQKLFKTAAIACIMMSFFFIWCMSRKEPHHIEIVRKKTVTNENSSYIAPLNEAFVSPKKINYKRTILKNRSVKKMSFEDLPGWKKTDIKQSLLAFQVSCETFLKQSPQSPVGSKQIDLKAGDWHPACQSAIALNSVTDDKAQEFFEKWFLPVEFTQNKSSRGLFTGYYMPLVKGSLTKTSTYNTPIYGFPFKKVKGLSHYTRERIDNGGLADKAPVIAWIDNPIDRLFLEIEGSGVVEFPDGKRLYLGYAGENGARYTSIAHVLIRKGILNKHNASTGAIKRYLQKHPKIMSTILHQNKSFVFFEDLKQPAAMGAHGVPLTAGYSLAIDKKWIPLGAPLWLVTKKPDENNNQDTKFERLMIAQDTGGAIRGLSRGDIYWGEGASATYLATHMKNKGHYWLLLPKHLFRV